MNKYIAKDCQVRKICHSIQQSPIPHSLQPPPIK